MVKHWDRISRDVVEPLEMFKTGAERALLLFVSMVGFGQGLDLVILEVFSNINDSIIP